MKGQEEIGTELGRLEIKIITEGIKEEELEFEIKMLEIEKENKIEELNRQKK